MNAPFRSPSQGLFFAFARALSPAARASVRPLAALVLASGAMACGARSSMNDLVGAGGGPGEVLGRGVDASAPTNEDASAGDDARDAVAVDAPPSCLDCIASRCAGPSTECTSDACLADLRAYAACAASTTIETCYRALIDDPSFPGGLALCIPRCDDVCR